jgi:hypothetical protein
MLIPSNYTGVLFFDDSIPKASIKLSTERKSIHRQIILLIQTNLGKNVAKDQENQRLISVLIILLNLDINSHSNVQLGYKYFRFFQLSCEGKLISCKGEFKSHHKEIQLIGMDNLWNTSCYIDSLIVSLFYSNSSLDYLLDKTLDPNMSSEFQQQIERLKIILRFIVNLLRAGEHINTKIIYQLFIILNALGCDMVMSGKQQDALQIFEFIAESLSLPLLTLKLDIIHTGKLNVNDDLRLIGERSLFISIPTLQSPSTINQQPITLEECLNSYFNNSITVRRHIDQKMSMTTIPTMKNNNKLKFNDSDESLTNDESEISEISEYEKLGILTSSTSLVSSTTPIPLTYTVSVETEPKESNTSISTSPGQSTSAITDSSSPSQITPYDSNTNMSILNSEDTLSTPNPFERKSSSIMEFSPNQNMNRSMTNSSNLDSVSLVPSFQNVTQKLERQRTRSSTLASVLNNVSSVNPSKLTRRSSSISNTEVSLPAWMYLQLLPYYTNPEVKLTVENHEEYYRRRISRSKTIESIQKSPYQNEKNSDETFKQKNDENDENDDQVYFDKKFGNKRPLVPICLKRYIWNERGQSVKIQRKVIIPEIIKYPYFIAEDKTKPGFVDFKRSFDHKAPRGSFMLVLQSCICHRGNSTNSGHYVSLVRKKQFDLSQIDCKSEWVLFNDMEVGSGKAIIYTFEEAMEKEDPYILFYEIFELKSDIYQVLANDKNSSTYNRKPSVISGFSGYSEQTLSEEFPTEDSKLTSSAKHVMHLSLAGLTLSKSKSKNIDSYDVLDDYYWYDNSTFNSSLTNLKSNISIKSSYSLQRDKSSYQGVSIGSSNSMKNLSNEEFTKICISELEDGISTSDSFNNDLNNDLNNDGIEYTEDDADLFSENRKVSMDSTQNLKSLGIASNDKNDLKLVKSNKSTKSNSNTKHNENKTSISLLRPNINEIFSENKSNKKSAGNVTRKKTVKNLFKKVFS